MAQRLATWALALFLAGIPLDVVPAASFRSISGLLAIPFVVLSLFALLERRRVRRLAAPLMFLTLYAVWSAASLLWSIDDDATIDRAVTYAQLAVFLFLAWQMLFSRTQLLVGMSAFVVGDAITALSSYFAFMQGEMYSNEARYAASGYDPNDMGLTLAIGVPVAAYLFASSSSKWKWLALAFIPFSIPSILLSGSRGASLAMVVAIISVPLTIPSRGIRARVAAAGAVGGAAALVASLVPEEVWDRLFTIGEQVTGGTLGQRLPIWKAGLDTFTANWLLGVGAGAYPRAMESALGWNIVAHNTFLSVAAEIGSVGLFLFIAALVSGLKGSAQASNRERATAYALMATWAIGVSTLTWEYRKTTWLVLLFIAALGQRSMTDSTSDITRRPR